MWEDIHNWIEQYAGVSYDVSEYIQALSGNAMFTSPRTWYNTFSITLELLSNAVDVISEYGSELPDDLPSAPEVKRFMTSEVLFCLVQIVNYVKEKIGIDPTDIRSFTTLEQHVDVLVDLISNVTENTIDELIKSDWFDEYDEGSNNFLTDTFGLSKHDLPAIALAVQDIIEIENVDE
jgi:hypothetical protein